jgi:hypothetical protein
MTHKILQPLEFTHFNNLVVEIIQNHMIANFYDFLFLSNNEGGKTTGVRF